MEINSGAVDGGNCVSRGWELVKSHFGNFLVMILIFFAIAMGAGMVVSLINNIVSYAVGLSMGVRPGAAPSLNTPFVVTQGVTYLVGNVLGIATTTLTGIMSVGLLTAIRRADTEGEVVIGDMFGAFTKWKPCLVYALVATAFNFVMTVFVVGLLAAGVAGTVGFAIFTNGDAFRNLDWLAAFLPVAVIVVLASLVIAGIIGVLLLNVYPLIARGVGAIDAITLSARAGLKNFGGLFVLIIINSILMLIGAIPCLLGLFVVIPVTWVSIYYASESIFGPMRPDDGSVAPPSPGEYGFQNY